MMKKGILRITVLMVFLWTVAFFGSAGATVISVSGAGSITATGQDFTFSESGLPVSGPVENASFTIWAGGDFSPGNKDEYLTWDIDSLVSAQGGPEDGGSVTAEKDESWDNGTWPKGNLEYNQVAWNRTWAIDSSVMDSILADAAFTLTIDLSDAVDKIHSSGWGEEGNAGDYIIWKLTYETSAPVPEPATILLLGAGLAFIGVAGRRFKGARS